MGEISERLSNKLRNMSIVCACFVVVMHVRPQFTVGTTPWYIKQFLELGITYISVPYFFTASGFFLAGNYLSSGNLTQAYAKAIKKRLASLVLPYFIWMSLWLFVTLTLRAMMQYVNSGELIIALPSSLRGWLKAFGLSPLGLPNMSVLWFVRNLIFLAFVSPVIFLCIRKCGMLFLAILFVLYAVTYPWPERLLPRDFYDLLFWNGIFSLVGFFWFSLGMAFRMGMLQIEFNRRYIIPVFLVGVVMSGLRAYFVLHGRPLPVALFGFASMLIYLYFVWGIMPDVEWPKWLVYASFPIFLMHKFILLFSDILVNRYMGGDSLTSYCIESAFGFIIPIVVAALLRARFRRMSAILFGGR